jgi:hypothetical protein
MAKGDPCTSVFLRPKKIQNSYTFVVNDFTGLFLSLKKFQPVPPFSQEGILNDK